MTMLLESLFLHMIRRRSSRIPNDRPMFYISYTQDSLLKVYSCEIRISEALHTALF